MIKMLNMIFKQPGKFINSYLTSVCQIITTLEK